MRISEFATKSGVPATTLRLVALPDRDAPCDTDCSVLGPSRQLPVTSLAIPRPIGCSLKSGYFTDRTNQWHRLLIDAPQTTVPGGVRATLPTTKIAQAAEMLAALLPTPEDTPQ